MYKFYPTTGRWSFIVDGKTVATSNDKTKLEQKVAKLYGNFVAQESTVSGEAEMTITKPEFSVAERFSFIQKFTKLVAKGVMPSLIVTGSGGLGKTHTILTTLSVDLGLREDTIGSVDGDFVFIKGYTTPRNLYTTLYHNNGKVIVFDDCDSSFKDPIGANIFKAALDSSERRIISWGAESKDDEVPSRFEFTGKVIFISNMEMGKFPQALVSRSMLTDLTLNMEEKVERIAQIFDEETQYDSDDKSEVLGFIRENMAAFHDLNIRSAFNTLKMKVALGNGWERAALYSATLN